MTRTVAFTERIDKKKVDELTLEKKFAYAAILEGQVVSLGATNGVVIPCTAQTIPYGVACNGVTAALIAAAAFPDAEPMAAVWCAKVGAAAESKAQMDWWRAVQLG